VEAQGDQRSLFLVQTLEAVDCVIDVRSRLGDFGDGPCRTFWHNHSAASPEEHPERKHFSGMREAIPLSVR
jgi:hypothetical protein